MSSYIAGNSTGQGIVHKTNWRAFASWDAHEILDRADRDDRPVDRALLDTSRKQQGTYSKRVLVDRQWKRYELKCRLHNELTELYVGFKVYSGTVWADDAEHREAGGI